MGEVTNLGLCHAVNEQEYSYPKQIARKLRTQYVDDINSNTVILKSRLSVTQDHGKWYNSKVCVHRL